MVLTRMTILGGRVLSWLDATTATQSKGKKREREKEQS
jgi:hypothetical protein